MKTYTPRKEELQKKWYLVDVQGKILGRAATKIARLLLGKDNPLFTPHLDSGDYVIVINADKVVLSGKKENIKTYHWNTLYPGGLRSIVFSKWIKENPEELFRFAVKGMLPHNRLGRKILSKLHVYSGEKHPHPAQKPEKVEI
jgi:large subunit ribosomal protein L13